ncbi:hypothetical protein ACIA8E_39535 [Streptomyces sp. NPDC051664]|uniref:hypothetical protein n=1 Tax=Streptomyces sp. NPDC051664 TaxID=3365668 RepID=UPI0037B6E751
MKYRPLVAHLAPGTSRLNRGGNRTINNALHVIAVTQVCGSGEGTTYYTKQIAAGETVKEALRLLKRRVSGRVFRALFAEESDRLQ